MKKRTVIIVLLVLVLLAIPAFRVIHALRNDLPLHFGRMWRESPEEAIEWKMNNLPGHHSAESKKTYQIRTLLDEINVGNDRYYIYISESNYFTVMQLVHDPATDKWDCLDPIVYPYNPDAEQVPYDGSQFDLWECTTFSVFYSKGANANCAFAFLTTGVAKEFYFNGVRTEVRTYTFEDNGILYSVDCFYTDDLPKDASFQDLEVGIYS